MTGTGPWAAQANVEPIAAVTIQALANSALYNVLSGCAGTYSGAAMTLTIAAGSVTHNGTTTTVAGNDVTLVADPSNPRWTYTYLNSSGTAALVSGSAAATPAVPDPGANVTAQLTYVQAALTIASNATYKLDKRVTAVSFNVFNGIRDLFRTGRKVLGEYSASTRPGTDGTTNIFVANFANGFAFAGTSTSALPTSTQIGGEQYDAWVTGTATTVAFGSVNVLNANNTAGQLKLPTAPNKNPRLLVRWIPGASNASLTTTQAGFFQVTVDNAATATSNGAYLRANTTGNLFFVTRQGTETTTDLGTRPTVLTSYEIETADAGVTWTCRNSTTGVVVATHTGTPPTASTAVGYGFNGVSGSGSLACFGISYARVEANFTP